MSQSDSDFNECEQIGKKLSNNYIESSDNNNNKNIKNNCINKNSLKCLSYVLIIILILFLVIIILISILCR